MATIGDATWHELLKTVRMDAPNVARSWFSLLRPAALEHGTLRIHCLTTSQREFLEERARPAFIEAVRKLFGRLVAVEFRLEETTHGDDAPSDPAPEQDRAMLWPWLYRSLRDDWTLDDFVVGPCNRLSRAVAEVVSESPGQVYNPLFIHGGSCVGKSHLLQAICGAARRNHPQKRCLYLTCADFSSACVEAAGADRLDEFRTLMRGADLLALDDVHELGARPRSQEEFFHAFNALLQNHAQIVVASDRLAQDVAGLEARLTSRFQSGLAVALDPPCYETRLAILRRKCKLLCIDASEEILAFIAARNDDTARDLGKALSRIDALAQDVGTAVTLEVARRALGDAPQPWVTLSMVADAVGRRFGVKQDDLAGPRRTRTVAVPRQVSMYLARQMTQHSLHDIGRYFGGRDHTTVLHAVRHVAILMRESSDFSALIEDLRVQLLRGTAA